MSGDTKILDRIILGLGIVCALLVVGDLFIAKHPHETWEGWIAFFALFGFASYSFIVYAGRGLRKLIMRREDYYE